MNNYRILETAKLMLPDLVEINKDIYRGTLNIENKIAGICFIDLKNDKKENFEDYQEKLISKEFYSNPGSLQWNYYLFLLNDNLTGKEVLEIESDDKYARKYVLDENNFIDFFSAERNQKITQPNIVSEWKKALEDVDLQELYTDESYVNVFERFSIDKTKKEIPFSGAKAKKNVEKIQFINKLKLKDNFRLYPKTNREFNFGKVNLFKGINGVGKTSVFEGIELMLCGKSFRNIYQDNPNGCIEAEFNGNPKIEKYQSDNQALFQSRDHIWYSSTYNRGNNLYNSFNRFNYFNADAAHSFASSKTEAEVMEALNSIVLGPEFTYIQDRCTKMIEKIRPEFNKLKNSTDTANNEIIADKKLIDEFIEPDDIKFVRERIQQEIDLINFRQDKLDIQNSLAQIGDLNNQIGVSFQSLSERNFQYDSIHDFNIAIEKFKIKKSSIEKLIEEIRVIGKENSNLLREQKEYENTVELLNNALGYLKDERYLELDGISKKITDQNYLMSKTDFVQSMVIDIDLEEINSSLTIEQYILKERNLLETLMHDSFTLRQSMDLETEKIGNVNSLIKELKIKGIEYLNVAPLAKECPLCDTSFDRELLEQRINKILGADQIDVDKFKLDNSKLTRLNDEKVSIEKKISIIEKIKTAYLSFFGTEDSKMSIDDILIKIEDILIKKNNINSELQRLKNIENFGSLAGKSEIELLEIKSKIIEKFSSMFEFSLVNLGKFKEKLTATELHLEDNKNQYEKNISDRFEKGLAIKLLLDVPSEDRIDVKAVEEMIKTEDNNIELYSGYIDKIKSIINLNDNIKFSNIKNYSDILGRSIQLLKESLSSEIVINQARKRLEKNEELLKLIVPKKRRFEIAYNKLLDLTDIGGTKRIQDFFDSNLNEIINIFKAIHIPREFSNLKFENKRLTLITNAKEERFITEISTGQRSALALSIFLSLNNKLVNGPDIIMFDDPVAFIDDLNALSFLDYLRLNVLKTGKQIFFATANTRLAHLFEKKFAFLDKEFKQWHLQRN